MKTISKNIKGIVGICLMLSIFSSQLSAQTIEDGLKQIDYQQYKRAKNIFVSFLAKNPTNAQAMFYVGESYFLLGNNDSAKYYFAKGIETDSKNPYNNVGIGKVELLKNNREEAGKNFSKAISINKSKDAKVYVYLADAYIKIKDYDQALTFLTKAKEIDKTIGEIYIKYADVFLAQVKAGDALTMLGRSTDMNKNFAKGYFYTGYIYSLARSYMDAKDAFNKVIAIDSNFVPVWKELGELEFMARKYNLASANYKKYISIADYTLDDRVRYASMLFLNKEYDLSKKEIDEIFKIDSSNVNLKRLLAYSSYETGDYPKGLLFINNFLKSVDPAKILASDYEYQGKLLIKTGQDSLGMESLDKAVKKDSSTFELFFEVAKDFDKQKKFKWSIEAYNKLIEKRTTPLASDYYLIGKAYYFYASNPKLDSISGRAFYVKADTSFGKFIELNNTYLPGYKWKAATTSFLFPDMKVAKAKPYYEKVIELGEPNKEKNKKDLIDAYRYMGYYYYANEDRPKSKNYWEKIKELDPANADAEKWLKELR